ncbi:carbohydrate ABC transporter permease [Bradyrhizobium sp. LHD-71]|uniref:carbohydrate ABC transporter permease n=1 Tax=Bradyrhizobium sp. LHD-71 TaxID=3072141 RepID=UPI00280F6EF3|nr:carbohydrate ABC transporter permease [Bradyrhizobium sp. LHD-71]MDQ8726838.1 carbohydrate ABC transporter permease [Bradyrhizobium sp. LHD-71]
MNCRAILRLALLIGLVVLFLAPYAYMLGFSVKPASEIFGGSLSPLPTSFAGFANYVGVIQRRPLLLHLANGAVVCAGILFFQLLFALPCAYALAKLRFAGREAVFGLVLFGLLIPIQVTALPIYAGFAGLRLLDTYGALIVPFVSSAFAVFLFRQFFRSIPDEMIDAARLDGLGEISILVRVVLPLTLPAATAFGIFSVVSHWNDLFWPLIVVRSPELNTPPLGLLAFRSAEAGDRYGELMAATVLVTAPLILVFLVAQRRFVEGISLGALKG